MLKEFWYIAAASHELTGKQPLGRQLLGQRVVLWRDSAGVAHAIKDMCIHRSVPLSQGEVDGDWVRCPFHGWAYDGTGRCTLIPSNGPDAPVPSNARTRSYPVQERSGYIWVYTGSKPEPQPLLIPEELTSSEWTAGRRYDDVNANYTRVIEQSIDIAHVPWVHRKTIGRRLPRDGRIERPMVGRPTGLTLYFEDRMPDWMEAFHEHFNKRTEAPTELATGDGVHFDMPNLFRVVQGGMVMGLYAVPIDEGHTRIYQYVARRWLTRTPILSSLFSWFTTLVNRQIVREDTRMLEVQVPKRMPEEINEEFQVRTDEAEIYYRKLRAAYFAEHPDEHPRRVAAQPDVGSWAAARVETGQSLHRSRVPWQRARLDLPSAGQEALVTAESEPANEGARS